MRCFCDIDDYVILVSIIALVVGFISLIVALIAIRYQIIILINTQLADKARECNKNLDSKNRVSKETDKVSWILSSIITAEELMNYQLYLKRNISLICLNKQSMIDQFYLQLHTSIRVFLQKGDLSKNDIDDQNPLEQLKEQYKRATKFLYFSIKRDKEKFFEKLHIYSLKNK